MSFEKILKLKNMYKFGVQISYLISNNIDETFGFDVAYLWIKKIEKEYYDILKEKNYKKLEDEETCENSEIILKLSKCLEIIENYLLLQKSELKKLLKELDG